MSAQIADHKRIAILYLISITFFFFVGGAFAGLIRLELLTPLPDLVASDTYNKLFSMHGIIMVFFFLVPSVPAVIGNFVLPIMLGAKDLAFPVVKPDPSRDTAQDDTPDAQVLQQRHERGREERRVPRLEDEVIPLGRLEALG